MRDRIPRRFDRVAEQAPLALARALLTWAVAGLAVLQGLIGLLIADSAGDSIGQGVGLGLVALWAVAHHRFGSLRLITDLVPATGLYVYGASGGEGVALVATAALLVLFRALYVSPSRAALIALLYGLALGAVEATDGHGLALQAANLLGQSAVLLTLVPVGAIMSRVGEVLTERDKANRRDRVLAQAGHELVGAPDRSAVTAAVRRAVAELAAVDGATVGVLWTRVDDALELVEPSPWRETASRLPLHLVAEQITAALQSGKPFAYRGTEAHAVQRLCHDAERREGFDPVAVLAPVRMGSDWVAAAIISCSEDGEGDLREVLERLSLISGLAYDRVDLFDRLRANEERFRSVVDSCSDVIAIVDLHGAIQMVSPSVRTVLGYAPGKVVGVPVREALHPEDGPLLDLLIAQASHGALDRVVECRIRHRDGTWLHTEVTANRLRDGDEVTGLVMSIRDTTHRKQLESELTFRAFHDQLTGLANRTMFERRVEEALARSSRHRDGVAVVFIDLDDFKAVNDSLGHAAGDTLLQAVARRLESHLRPGDLPARLGGDEFALLLEEIPDDESLGVARRVMAALDAPFEVQGRDLLVRASAGVATGHHASEAAADLLRNADLAMYVAKRGGKARVEQFAPWMHERSVERLELRFDLEAALRRDELVLHFQPVVTLADGGVTGCEALLRWQHPTRGLLAPDTFIGLAEESGLIVDIGRWVLREACRQAASWPRLVGGARPLIGVNVAPRELAERGFVAGVQAALAEAGLHPGQLVIEVTERTLIEDLDGTVATLRQLRDLGVLIAIDDFGAGYSGLGYLRDLPVTTVKIDRSFISSISEGPEGAAVAQAVVKLAQGLGLDTVAEGIESADQLQPLIDWGCGYGQGYWFARPLPADAIQAFLAGAEALGAPAELVAVTPTR